MRFVNTKTILLLGFVLILLLIIKNIVASIMSIDQNSHIVTSLKQQENDEKQKNQFLKQELYYVNTPQFVEQQAREKLGMVKPGEHIVILPSPQPTEQSVAIDTTPNWKKWWNLFF